MRKQLGGFLLKGVPLMLETLKELGIVCNNKKMAEKICQYHLRNFFYFYKTDKQEAKRHRSQFLFWSEKIEPMKEHIEQLHKKIKNCR